MEFATFFYIPQEFDYRHCSYYIWAADFFFSRCLWFCAISFQRKEYLFHDFIEYHDDSLGGYSYPIIYGIQIAKMDKHPQASYSAGFFWIRLLYFFASAVSNGNSKGFRRRGAYRWCESFSDIFPNIPSYDESTFDIDLCAKYHDCLE